MVSTESFPINANTSLHRKVFSAVATERASATGAWTDTLTAFTLTHGVNSLLQFLRMKFDTKNVGGGVSGVRLKITGATLTTTYVECISCEVSATPTASFEPHLTTTSGAVTVGLAYTDDASYRTMSYNIPTDLKLPDSQTVFTVQITTNGAGTSYIQNVELDAIYSEGFTDD